MTSNATCLTSPTASDGPVTITLIPAPAVPTVTSTAASCAADGTSTITNFDNTLTYTVAAAGRPSGREQAE